VRKQLFQSDIYSPSATSREGTAFPTGAPKFTSVYRSLNGLLSYFLWPLCCLFFDLWLLITRFEFSNFFILQGKCVSRLTSCRTTTP